MRYRPNRENPAFSYKKRRFVNLREFILAPLLSLLRSNPNRFISSDLDNYIFLLKESGLDKIIGLDDEIRKLLGDDFVLVDGPSTETQDIQSPKLVRLAEDGDDIPIEEAHGVSDGEAQKEDLTTRLEL